MSDKIPHEGVLTLRAISEDHEFEFTSQDEFEVGRRENVCYDFRWVCGSTESGLVFEKAEDFIKGNDFSDFIFDFYFVCDIAEDFARLAFTLDEVLYRVKHGLDDISDVVSSIDKLLEDRDCTRKSASDYVRSMLYDNVSTEWMKPKVDSYFDFDQMAQDLLDNEEIFEYEFNQQNYLITT